MFVGRLAVGASCRFQTADYSYRSRGLRLTRPRLSLQKKVWLGKFNVQIHTGASRYRYYASMSEAAGSGSRNFNYLAKVTWASRLGNHCEGLVISEPQEFGTRTAWWIPQ